MTSRLPFECGACGATYYGRRAALQCCSHRFEPDPGPDGHRADWKAALGGDAHA